MTSTSWDGSKQYVYDWMAQKYVQVLWGNYFFLSDEVVEYQQTVRNILDVLSSVGGIFSLLGSVLGTLFIFINNQFIKAKFIRALYFQSHESSEELQNQPQDKGAIYLKFNWKNKFVSARMALYKLCCCCRPLKLSKQDKFFLEGQRLIERDLSIFYVIQTMHKLKVTMAVLLSKQFQDLIPEIMDEYIRYQKLDSEAQGQTKLTPDDLHLDNDRDLAMILDFLNRDEKHAMRRSLSVKTPKENSLNNSMRSEVEMSLAK